MSYAGAVKDHGPKQSDADVSRDPPPFPFTAQATQEEEQKLADAVPEIAHSDSSNGAQSIDSLSSDTVNVPSFADQQKEAEETAERAKKDASKAADEVSKDAKDFGKKAEKEGQRLQAEGGKKLQEMYKDGQDGYEKVKKDAKTEYGKAKKELSQDSKEAEKKAKEAEEWADKNKQNPVVIGNVVVVGAIAALLGTGAYRMHKAGTLTWQVAGMWAGVVGLFGVGDFYFSQFLFKNKYPPK